RRTGGLDRASRFARGGGTGRARPAGAGRVPSGPAARAARRSGGSRGVGVVAGPRGGGPAPIGGPDRRLLRGDDLGTEHLDRVVDGRRGRDVVILAGLATRVSGARVLSPYGVKVGTSAQALSPNGFR